MGADAREAVPALTKCLRDGWGRDHLVHAALQKLGPHARAAAPVLRRYLTGEEPCPDAFRRALLFPLQQNGGWTPSRYEVAIRRLGDLAVKKEWAATMLVREWKHAPAARRWLILEHLQDARLLGEQAIPDVVDLLKHEMAAHPYPCWGDNAVATALRALSAFGPAAHEAIPMLRYLLLRAIHNQTVDAIEAALALAVIGDIGGKG